MKNEDIQNRIKKIVTELTPDILLKIDTTASVELYKPPDQYRENFMLNMAQKEIQILSEYIDKKTRIKLKCNRCNKEWFEFPHFAIKAGCTECQQLASYEKVYIKLYERTLAIISDKRGFIVKPPVFDLNHKPNVNDELIVECHRGHQFTTSHKKLRRDSWCACQRQHGYADRPVSDAVYNTIKTKHDKQKQIAEFCDAKGAQLLSKKLTNGTYKISCNICNAKFYKTFNQIKSLVYLCPNKCIKGQKFKNTTGRF